MTTPGHEVKLQLVMRLQFKSSAAWGKLECPLVVINPRSTLVQGSDTWKDWSYGLNSLFEHIYGTKQTIHLVKELSLCNICERTKFVRFWSMSLWTRKKLNSWHRGDFIKLTKEMTASYLTSIKQAQKYYSNTISNEHCFSCSDIIGSLCSLFANLSELDGV